MLKYVYNFYKGDYTMPTGKFQRNIKKQNNRKVCYLLVRCDEYELPVFVTDYLTEIALLTGKKIDTLYHAICRKSKTYTNGIPYYIEVVRYED